MHRLSSSFRDSLLKGISFLFAGNLIASICNYLFQFFMSRHLSIADYGAMNSLLSLMVIVSVPAVSILLVSAKYVSNFKVKRELEKIRLFRKKVFARLISLGAAVLILLLFISPLVSSFLRINSYIPVVILFMILFFSFLIPLNLGTLQGLQKFFHQGICESLIGSLRLIWGIILIALGLRLNGALLAILASSLCVFFISFNFLRYLPKNDSQSNDLGIGFGKILTYSRAVVLSSLGIIVLTNVDMIMVKHYFSAEQAGIYASVAVLGRTVFYFPGVIIVAMFPIVSETYALKKNPFGIMKKALGITMLLSGLVLMVLMAFPDLMLSFLFGKAFSEGASLVRIFALAMFFTALNNVLCIFLLAIERTRFTFILLMGCVVEIILICFLHQKLMSILIIMTVVSFLIFASLIYQTLRVDFKESLVQQPSDLPLVDIKTISVNRQLN